MRLQKLSLDRFGHFTDQHIEFGKATDAPDFHIIYGPNEAGKTTTMEAALRLLYGFPAREPYDFKHQRKNLQVSGQLEIDGQTHCYTRLPKRKGSLCDEKGVALPETALATHLAGLSLEDYRKLLCLDDETIERGGDEIAQAEGDIGRLLFSAAAGVADLSEVLSEVSESADNLWRKRATTTRIATLKRELAEVEGEIRQLDISASKWRTLKKQHTEALESEKSTRDVCKAHRIKISQIEASLRALPRLKELDSIQTRIAAFVSYPVRLDFDPEDLVTLQNDEAGLQADIKRLNSVIENTQMQLNELERTPELVALSGRLDDLDELRARDVTAAQDIERRRKEKEDQFSLMQNAVREIGADDTADPHSLVLSAADIERLVSLRDALRSAIMLLDSETREVEAVTERCDIAREKAEDFASQTTEDPVIGDLLEQFNIEHLSQAYSSALQSIATVEQSAARAMDDLTTGQTKFSILPTPASSTIKAQEWYEQHTELNRQISETGSALADHLEDCEARSAQLKQMESGNALVSDTQAGSLREKRDQLWQSHKDALTEATARQFEGAMQAHDAATESRIGHGSELGQLRQIEKSLTEATARFKTTEQRLSELKKQRTLIEHEVNQSVASVGIETVLTPAEWLQWMKHYDAAVELSKDIDDQKNQHQPTIERMQQLHPQLCDSLGISTPDIDTVIAKARTQAHTEKEDSVKRNALQEKLSEIELELSKRKKRLKKAEDEKQSAEEAWSAQMSLLFGNATIDSPTLADSLLQSIEPLRTLRENNNLYQRTAQRINAMEQDQAQFQKELTALCNSHKIPMQESAANTFLVLREQSREAREVESKAANLTEKLEKAKADLKNQTQELKQLTHRVKSISSIFPQSGAVDTLQSLRETAIKAQQVIDDRTDCDKLERVVTTEMNADSITDARNKLQNTSEAELQAEAEATKAELENATQQSDLAIEARTLAEKALSDIYGGAEIATLQERKATIELQLEDAAMQYLTLSLGHTLADTAIHRYRDKHRSSMMAATERCFTTLTQSRYPKLTAEPDAGKETLLAVDKAGISKRVDALSKGTRFQLYLALRAAAHEQMVNQGTRLPFFCDDIFETFDEERTSAACQVMEQIGQQGQAIYLTHHQHVVDIAQRVCTVCPTIHKIK